MRPKGGAQPFYPHAYERATPLSADALVTELARDLSSGFELLARSWQNRLYAFALRMTGSPADAEDLAQETLVRAWRALGSYPPARLRALQVRPWLFQIAVNLTRNRARSASRASILSLEALASFDAHDLGERHGFHPTQITDEDPTGDPVEALDRRLRLSALAESMLALPEQHRLALTLRHIEGLSYTEIAAATGLPAGTVKSHASRGAAELRRVIQRERAREAYRVETEVQR